MNFFDTVVFDNSIKSYCIVVGTIIFTLIFKRYFSKYIATILFKIANKIWKQVDKKSFIDLVLDPLDWLLVIVITVFSIDKLNFPTIWHLKIYGHYIDEILDKIGEAIIVIAFTRFFLRIIDFIAIILEKNATVALNKSNDQLVIFFRDFLKVLVGIVGILLLIKVCFNQPITGLLTSLSIVGAAIALAAKESLENLIASFIIFFDKPFATGDTLKVNSIIGIIERIGLRSTRIRTIDKTLVTVPNKQMVDSIVDNWSTRTQRRAEIKLELAINTPTISLQKIIVQVKQLFDADKNKILSYSVYLTDFSKVSNIITVEYFTNDMGIQNFSQLKENFILAIKKIIEDNNVSFSKILM